MLIDHKARWAAIETGEDVVNDEDEYTSSPPVFIPQDTNDGVYVLSSKELAVTTYTKVALEDANDVFYTYSQLSENTRSVYWNYDIRVAPTGVLKLDLDNQVILVDFDAINAHVQAQFADKKVKEIPFALPNNFYFRDLNKGWSQMGFGYSESKQAFVRKKPSVPNPNINKSYVMKIKRTIINRLTRQIRLQYGFGDCELNALTNNNSLNNAVVFAKKLGITLTDLAGDWKRMDDDSMGYFPCVPSKNGTSIDILLQSVTKNDSLSEKHYAQLRSDILHWWRDAKVTIPR